MLFVFTKASLKRKKNKFTSGENEQESLFTVRERIPVALGRRKITMESKECRMTIKKLELLIVGGCLTSQTILKKQNSHRKTR